MELWDAYDAMGRKVKKTLVRGEAVPAGLRHLVVHLWYQNAKGELLIQRRALTKDLAPGIWAATGGSALQGETIEDALIRESREEMSITPDLSRTKRVLTYYTLDCITEVFLTPFEGPAESLILQEEEVMEAKWVSLAEFRKMIGTPGRFWEYRYLGMLLQYLQEEAEGRAEEV